MKVKVDKWWNEHIDINENLSQAMWNYAKSQWKGCNGQLQRFYKVTLGALCSWPYWWSLISNEFKEIECLVFLQMQCFLCFQMTCCNVLVAAYAFISCAAAFKVAKVEPKVIIEEDFESQSLNCNIAQEVHVKLGEPFGFICTADNWYEVLARTISILRLSYFIQFPFLCSGAHSSTWKRDARLSGREDPTMSPWAIATSRAGLTSRLSLWYNCRKITWNLSTFFQSCEMSRIWRIYPCKKIGRFG